MSQCDWLLPLISAAGAVLGALVGGGITYHIQKLNIKNYGVEQRRQAYSQLKGKKILFLQSYSSYYSAFIQSQLYDSYCSLETVLGKEERIMSQDDTNKYITGSVSCQETIKMKTRSENMELEIAKNISSLWETIGRIQVLFPDAAIKVPIDELTSKLETIDEKFSKFSKQIVDEKNNKFDFINQHVDKYYLGSAPKVAVYPHFPGKENFVDSRPAKNELDVWSKAKSEELKKWGKEKVSELEMLIKELKDTIDKFLGELLKIINGERTEPAGMMGPIAIFIIL